MSKEKTGQKNGKNHASSDPITLTGSNHPERESKDI